METCNSCIEEACVELEKLGWTKESVKAIGMSVSTTSPFPPTYQDPDLFRLRNYLSLTICLEGMKPIWAASTTCICCMLYETTLT